jgi:hypothetical protein
MIVVGIDGGLGGGISVYDGVHLSSFVTPVIEPPKKGKGRRQYDLPAMRDLLEHYAPRSESFVWLEKAQPMSSGSRDGDEGARGGTLAAFSQGCGHGAWQMALVCLRIPYEIVAPQTWQKAMLAGIPGADTKIRSALVCKRLWPDMDWREDTSSKRSWKAHSGKTDSACIMEYGRRVLAKRGQLIEVVL